MQQLRYEAHRFGITHKRNKQSKAQVHSVHDDIQGIGEKAREALLIHFKSVKRIKESSIEQIAAVVGLAKAKTIHNSLNNNTLTDENSNTKG